MSSLSTISRQLIAKRCWGELALGGPAYTPIDKAHPKQPINPYGKTKWMVEQMLEDYDRGHGLESIGLRCFNAGGADPEGQLGEHHDRETHLIPLVLQSASGRRPHIGVFSRDYEASDGARICDYIHVTDLADAHCLALDKLMQGADSVPYNLGNGNCFSLQHVIDTAACVTGLPIPAVDAPRRDGDPARLVADSPAARKALNWQPIRVDLKTIIEDAWKWEEKTAFQPSLA